MDKLQACATTFLKLLDFEYQFKLGHKNKLYDVAIVFEPQHFYHLLGLHKLVDIEILREKRIDVFNSMLNGTIKYDSLVASENFWKIENRFEPFLHIENLLDANDLVFHYNERNNVFSVIKADYLLSTPLQEQDIYIFIDKDEDINKFFCRSFFPKEEKDYTIRQSPYRVMYKAKVNLLTNEKEIQIDRLRPKHQTVAFIPPGGQHRNQDEKKRPLSERLPGQALTNEKKIVTAPELVKPTKEFER